MSEAPTVDALAATLPALDWTTDRERVALLSRDFSWFSPILKAALEGKSADIAVRPRDEDELRALVAECARRRIPLTLRGAATGNYGQCTPLAGGVLVDMGAMNRVVWQRGGVVRAQAGIRLAELERRVRGDSAANSAAKSAKEGGPAYELRCMSSTFRVATLGGLFGGGFGGVGSVTYGPLGAPGNVLGARVLSLEPEPQVVELRGADALALHHTWGTTGIVLELELALAPAQEWLEMVVVFGSGADGAGGDAAPDPAAGFDAALDFGEALALAPGIPKRNIAVLADPVPGFITKGTPRWAPVFPAGHAAALIAVAASAEPAAAALAERFGGRVTHRADSAEAQRRNQTILEMTWNHSTLHALKVDPGRTYLQTAFTAGRHLEQVRTMHQRFGRAAPGEPPDAAEVLMHVEFIRSADGPLICTSLPLVRYTGEERLQEIIDAYRAAGVRVNNPHVRHVEDGRFGGTLPPAALAAKRRFDPLGLLNPGKLRTWPPPA
ncbi:MAG: FAD-binding oxidoreductase [Rubrivivax sp.]|nr:FAD-binding oxidoreductase [Rubrivivax sp.]